MYQQINYYTPKPVIHSLYQQDIFHDFLLVWAGVYFQAQGHLVTNRCIDEFVLVYCTHGKGWLEMNGTKYLVSSGDLFVCPPDTIHSYGADDEHPWTKYWFHIKGTKAEQLFHLLNLTLESPVISLGVHPIILQLFQQLFQHLETGYALSNILAATGDAYQILAQIHLLVTNGTFSQQHATTTQSVITYMLSHLCNQLSLEELAATTQLSKFHFSRTFKARTGYTPLDYFNRLKIQKACELLHSQAATITQISEDLGFNDVFYFSRVFKRITGSSPSLYRKNHIS